MAGAKTQEKLDKTLAFIKDFIKKNNYPPSVREICKEVGFKSTASVQYYLDKLEEQNLIRRSLSKNRTIELVNNDDDTPEFATLPLLGNIAAGQPLFAGVNHDESVHVPADYFNLDDDMFCLTVKGESMRDIGILNGDCVLIKRQSTAREGEIIVALIDNNEVTLKRFYKKDGKIVLHPENSTMQDIVVDSSHDFAILGVAKGLMRNRLYNLLFCFLCDIQRHSFDIGFYPFNDRLAVYL